MELKTVFSLKSLLLCFFLLSLITSCKKDDKEEECVPPALSTQLKGLWKADIVALSASLGKVDLTFTQDGEVQGDLSQYLAMMPGVGTIDELIKYEVLNDTSVKIIATSQGNEIPFELSVKERTCDKIVLVASAGVTITLTK